MNMARFKSELFKDISFRTLIPIALYISKLICLSSFPIILRFNISFIGLGKRLIDNSCTSIIALALSGPNAVEKSRSLIGKTNPLESAPGTIRGDFGLEISRNLIHGSATLEDANRELKIFFSKHEIIDYKKSTDSWVMEL